MSQFLGKKRLISLHGALPRVYLNDSSLKYSSGHTEHTKGLCNPLCRTGDLAETTHARAAGNNASPPWPASLLLPLLLPCQPPRQLPVPGCRVKNHRGITNTRALLLPKKRTRGRSTTGSGGGVLEEQGCSPTGSDGGVLEELGCCPTGSGGGVLEELGCSPMGSGGGVLEELGCSPMGSGGGMLEELGCSLMGSGGGVLEELGCSSTGSGGAVLEELGFSLLGTPWQRGWSLPSTARWWGGPQHPLCGGDLQRLGEGSPGTGTCASPRSPSLSRGRCSWPPASASLVRCPQRR